MRTKKIIRTQDHKGFTLVELAIAMVIIGLLILGILKGQELVMNAKATQTISEIKSIQTALNLFEERYGVRPGDIRDAENRIPNCSPANFCQGGNQDNVIGAPDATTDVYHSQSRISISSNNGMESFQLWKHLALTDILAHIQTNANPATPAWGETHPAAASGGGYEIYYDSYTTIGGAGHFLRLSRSGLNTGPWNNGISSQIGAQIDRKMDDGAPNSGFLRANYHATTDSCKIAGPNSTIVYNESSGNSSCTLYYLLYR